MPHIQKVCHGMIPKHNGDTTAPATPSLVRAMAFDVAKHDSTVVPQPPPPVIGWTSRPAPRSAGNRARRGP